MRFLGIGLTIGLVLATTCACANTGGQQRYRTATVPTESATVVAPGASAVATAFGPDPIDVALRQLSAEASQEPDRFSATLVATIRYNGVRWAHVSVRDTRVPPGFETEQVLLRTDQSGRFHVVVHGSGLSSEDAVSYGLNAESAPRLFP